MNNSQQSMSYEQAIAFLEDNVARQAKGGKGLGRAAVDIIEKSMMVNDGAMLKAATGLAPEQISVDEIVNIIVLVDGSWSMSGQERGVVNGLNKMLDDLSDPRNPDRDAYYVTLWIFRNEDAELVYANKPVISAPRWTLDDYKPNGSTPMHKTMLAAMGAGSLNTDRLRGNKGDRYRKMSKNIFVTISDGKDNHRGESVNGQWVEFGAQKVKQLVTSLLATEKWIICYAYAGQIDDLDAQADELGIPNRRLISRNDDSWRSFFGVISASARRVSAAEDLNSISNTFLNTK